MLYSNITADNVAARNTLFNQTAGVLLALANAPAVPQKTLLELVRLLGTFFQREPFLPPETTLPISDWLVGAAQAANDPELVTALLRVLSYVADTPAVAKYMPVLLPLSLKFVLSPNKDVLTGALALIGSLTAESSEATTLLAQQGVLQRLCTITTDHPDLSQSCFWIASNFCAEKSPVVQKEVVTSGIVKAALFEVVISDFSKVRHEAEWVVVNCLYTFNGPLLEMLVAMDSFYEAIAVVVRGNYHDYDLLSFAVAGIKRLLEKGLIDDNDTFANNLMQEGIQNDLINLLVLHRHTDPQGEKGVPDEMHKDLIDIVDNYFECYDADDEGMNY